MPFYFLFLYIHNKTIVIIRSGTRIISDWSSGIDGDGAGVGVGLGIAGAVGFGVVKNGEKLTVPRLKSFLKS